MMIITNSKAELGLYFDDDKPDLESLAHYGILGMKWGVRRTPEQLGHKTGRKVAKPNPYGFRNKKEQKQFDTLLAKAADEANDIRAIEQGIIKNGKQKHNITEVDKNTDIMKKGEIVHRLESPQEDPKKPYKYVSVFEEDVHDYRSMYEMLPGLWGRNNEVPVEREYRIKKDLKIASAEAVSDYIYELRKDTTIKKEYEKRAKLIPEYLKKFENIPYKDLKKAVLNDTAGATDIRYHAGSNEIKKAKKRVQEVIKELDDRYDALTELSRISAANITMYERTEIEKHFKKLGYDAVVDAEDRSDLRITSMAGFYYPLIIFDSADCMEVVKTTRIDELHD